MSFVSLIYGIYKGGTSPRTGAKTVLWTVLNPWKVPSIQGAFP